jgi:hypothetical protein
MVRKATKSTLKNREAQVFDIITGFYPEIAASVDFRSRKGTGPTGLKHTRKRGFTDQSIERDRTRGMAEDGPLGPTKETMVGAEGTSQEGKELYERKVGVKDDPNKIWYKFTGGSERYKLYGDQLWYMHGVRKTDTITDYVNSKEFGNKTPAFGNIYSKQEGMLVKEANKMANEIFDIAVGEVEKNIGDPNRKSGVGGEMASEEMGYKYGDFEYMSMAEAKSRYKGNEELMAQLDRVSSSSKANDRDLVKIKDGVVSTADVTEQAMTQKGQHGIMEVPKELKEAIKAVKEGGDKDMELLRQAVVSMYTKNFTEYNKVTTEMKKFANKNIKEPKWDDILKGMAGKAGTSSAGVSQMVTLLGGKVAERGLNKQSKKAGQQTAIEFISHVMGTMSADNGQEFAHTQKVYGKGGQSVWAAIPIEIDEQLMFQESALTKGEGVRLVTGNAATIALELKNNTGLKNSQLEIRRGQKRAYSMTKITGTTYSATGRASATAKMGVTKGARPATVVTIPAKGDLELYLQHQLFDALKSNKNALKGEVGQRAKKKLGERMYGLGKGRKQLRRQKNKDLAQFWALPYIGVLQSDHKA